MEESSPEQRSGTDRRSHWQDERLDDLSKLVHRNDERLDSMANLVAVHDLQLLEMNRSSASKSEHRFAIYLMIAAIFLGQIATVVTVVLEAHPK